MSRVVVGSGVLCVTWVWAAVALAEGFQEPKGPRQVTNSIGMQFVLIPAGEFMMGAAAAEMGKRDNELPQHHVKISRPLWLGVHEVTQTEYEQVMGYHDSNSHRFAVRPPGKSMADTSRFPVDEITWYQAAEFCNRLSEEEGLPPCYQLSPSKLGKVWKDVVVMGGPGYRLPTEAEWEYACRAGTTTPFSSGKTIDETQANVGGRAVGPPPRGRAAAVGSFPANSFGLYDMHGNVGEWCSDVYDARYYEHSEAENPGGPASDDPAQTSSRRNVVARGGYWGSSQEAARSAHRGEQFPWHRTAEIGFRVAKGDSPDWEQKLRDVAQRDAATTLSGHTETIMSLAFSPDGKTLASASDDRTIKLWVVATGKNTATLGGHTDHVLSVAFSPDGKTLASGSQDETIKLWEIATGNNIATFMGHKRGVASVVFSPDGRTLVSGSWDKSIKFWDVTAGHQTAVLDGHTWAVRFSPDGKSLASAGADKTIKLWDIASGKNTAILKGHVTVIHCLAYHPDGKTLASASGESAIKLWDTASGKNFATLQQDSGKIYYVAFSPDGKTLASACAGRTIASGFTEGDTTVRLWDLATGKSTVVIRGRPKGFRVVAFSPDGTTLASGNLDGRIKLSATNRSKR
jgi:WD40 repeat protein/formylglycine-generating enzyme required for sulfatase activity